MTRPQRPSKRRWHWSLPVGRLGSQLVFVSLIGLIALLLQPRPATLEAEILSLEPIDYQTLRSGALSDSDEFVVIIAKVAPNNEANEHGFVAHQAEHSEIDIRDQKIWFPESKTAPSLTLETEGGDFSILPDYSFGGSLHTIEAGRQRFQGLQIGDEVIVYGKLSSNRDRVIVDASYLFVGNYTDLRMQSFPYLKIMLSGIALIAGLVILALLWRAGHRPFDAYKPSSTQAQAKKSP